MKLNANHYIQNGINFYFGEPDVPSGLIHHHLTDEEADEMAKIVMRLKRNDRRRKRYAEKKALQIKHVPPPDIFGTGSYLATQTAKVAPIIKRKELVEA